MQANPSLIKEFIPIDWYRTKRATSPVFYDEKLHCWQIFRYDDILQVLTDTVTFSSDRKRITHQEDENLPVQSSILSMDPPRHRQLRSLVTQAFTPRVVAQMAPRITQITHELLDKVASTGTMDVVQDLATPLPVMVIAEMLGVPSEERERFKRWSDALIEGDFDYPLDERMQDRTRRVMQEMQELQGYFHQILDERRRNPQGDIVSSLLAAEVDGQRLSEGEVLGFCALLLIAGNITTTNLIGNAVLCFDEHPEVIDQLRNDPSLMPSAIEEVLRYTSPAIAIIRITTKETTLRDQQIGSNQIILGWLASANFDETQFTDPERFDIRREPNKHLSFGHGIHFCIGAPLARLESKIALNIMIERLPGIRRIPDVPVKRIKSGIIVGPQHVPVTFGVTEKAGWHL